MKAAKPYHHGDLATALLGAAAEILEQDGVPALTLRAIARRAGVSHMAPAHHFGDLSGLLSELAAHGYRLFNERLLHAQAHPASRSILRATGQAYVAFAQANPGLFLLMFRSERLDFTRPALAQAATMASSVLMRSAGPGPASHGDGPAAPEDSCSQVGDAASPEQTEAGKHALARAVFAWSVVHGFAMLLIDGRLEPLLGEPGEHRNAALLLDEALDSVSR